MKVLFLAEAVTWSQVVRLERLADGLDPRRFDVTFASARFDPALFGATTFRRERLRSLTPETVERRTRLAQRIYDHGTLASYVDEELALFRRLRPDVIVSDLRWSTTISAPASGIPLVTLVNAYWFRPLTEFPVPDHPVARLVAPVPLRRGFDLVLPRLLRHFAAPVNVLRVRAGLRPFTDLRDVLGWGTEVVFADDPLLVPSDRKGTYLGPISWSPGVADQGALARFGVERPGVYVTMGSSGDVSVLPKVIDALAPLGLDVLVASAGRRLPPLPRGVRVLEMVDGNEASKRAALVVCNGGASTAWQALANGTPVVGIPSNLDACLAMSCVSAFGAGIEVRPDATTERIREACGHAVASAALRARADELRVSASRIVPNARFFAVLESVAGVGRHSRQAPS